MIIKKIKFNNWEALKKNAKRYSDMGYDVEVRGWNDISGNILTIKNYDFKDIEKAAVES